MDEKIKTIEELYAKYKVKRPNVKPHLIMGGIRFDIDKKYEIIDLGKPFLKDVLIG